MKYFVVSLAVMAAMTVVLGQNKVMEIILRSYIKQCKGSSSSNFNVFSGNLSTNRDEMCFNACMMQKTHILTPDNDINVEMIKNLVRFIPNQDQSVNDLAFGILDKCKQSYVPATDACVSGYNYLKCLSDQTQNAGIPMDLINSEIQKFNDK